MTLHDFHGFISSIFDRSHHFLSIFIIFIVFMSFIDFSPHFITLHPVSFFHDVSSFSIRCPHISVLKALFVVLRLLGLHASWFTEPLSCCSSSRLKNWSRSSPFFWNRRGGASWAIRPAKRGSRPEGFHLVSLGVPI